MRSNSPTGVIPISAMKAPTRSDRKISLTRTAPGEPPRNRCRFSFIPGAEPAQSDSGAVAAGRSVAPIFEEAITAWVRLSTPSFCRIAETCALTVASETPSS